jgi:glycosyltransferase involved in cell wall biosynthesis
MSQKLKIVIASETYPPDMNGAAIFTQRLAKELSKRGHKVLMIAPNVKFKDELEKDKDGFDVFRVKSLPAKLIHPYFRFVDAVGLHSRMKKKIVKFKPDIVHIQNHFSVGSTALKIAKSLKIPVMGTNHFMPENLLQYVPTFIHKEVAKILWRHFKKIYKNLDFITSPSHAAVKMLKDMGLKNDMVVISNGIDLNKFKKHPQDKYLMKKYSIADDLPILLFVGRMEQDKNIDLLLRAAKIALKKTKFKIVLVGRGKNDKEFEKLSKELGLEESVVFTGRIDEEELEKMYSLANVYMATGSAELQGIAVMEAMTAGLPVLAINAIALPELVYNGENGYLFEKNEKDLADKIITILKDKKALVDMSKKSREIISEHDISKTITQFEDLYRKVISKMKA